MGKDRQGRSYKSGSRLNGKISERPCKSGRGGGAAFGCSAPPSEGGRTFSKALENAPRIVFAGARVLLRAARKTKDKLSVAFEFG